MSDEKTIVPDQVVYDVAHELLGSCMNTVYGLMEEHGFSDANLTMEQFGIIDNITFECSCCGWWCETGDYGESGDYEQVCSDCGIDEDE